MASPLDTIRTEIAKGFKGKLRKGVLRRVTATSLDELGDTATSTSKDYSFDGMRDSFNAAFLPNGVPGTDVRILIIGGSLAVTPATDDKILIEKQWFQVRKLASVDPADAVYTLAAFSIGGP